MGFLKGIAEAMASKVTITLDLRTLNVATRALITFLARYGHQIDEATARAAILEVMAKIRDVPK